MEVRVGDIVAQCPRCSCTQFQPTKAGSGAAMHAELECLRCAHRSTRGDLIVHIADEAVRRSRASRGHGPGDEKR
jgi:hypothetical protein